MNGKSPEPSAVEPENLISEERQQREDSALSQKRLKFLDREKRGFFSYKDSLGLLCVGTLALHLVNVVGLLLLYGAHSRLANQPPPALVQTESGEAFPVAAVGNLERTPETIETFVLESLMLLFTWSGTLPATEGAGVGGTSDLPDEGVEVDGGQRVATTAAVASYALSSDFREEMLVRLAEMTPAGVFSGGTQVFFEPLHLSEPVRLGEGEWKVVVVGNLIVVQDRRNLEDRIAFNKEIFVRAVVPPSVWEGSSPLAREISSVRAAGLEIFEMRDFED
ncbi:MAG: hypothetical protein SVX43_18280 [Cyanobacteriota bacterium]|nr:hypothetical protein [Cyanobacteriota bacterium]